MNFQRVTFLAIAVLCSISCSSLTGAVADSSKTVMNKVFVKEVARPPIETGIVPAWVRVVGLTSDKRQLELFIPYMSRTQNLPEVGASCVFSSRVGDVEGVVGVSSFEGKALQIVDQFDCE